MMRRGLHERAASPAGIGMSLALVLIPEHVAVSRVLRRRAVEHHDVFPMAPRLPFGMSPGVVFDRTTRELRRP